MSKKVQTLQRDFRLSEISEKVWLPTYRMGCGLLKYHIVGIYPCFAPLLFQLTQLKMELPLNFFLAKFRILRCKPTAFLKLRKSGAKVSIKKGFSKMAQPLYRTFIGPNYFYSQKSKNSGSKVSIKTGFTKMAQFYGLLFTK